LCYAFGILEEQGPADVESMPESEIADLFAEVLCSGIDRMVRRGIHRDYVEHREESRTIRGRIDFAASTSRLLLNNAMAAVTTSELSLDVLPNQILKTTLTYLRSMSRIGLSSLEKVASTLVLLREVSEIRLTRAAFCRVQIHGNNRTYRFLLDVCELIFEALMIAPDGQDCSFSSFIRDEVRMRRVWEQFLRNFYRANLDGYIEGRRSYPWLAESLLGLPTLHTDITLCKENRVIILDAKYTARTLVSTQYDSAKLDPSHVNQMFAYAMNMPGNWGERHAGLIYPMTDVDLRKRYVMDTCTLWAWTVDLSKAWEDVRRQLLQVVKDVELSGVK
jgi:5-methylcytosine-specific restriction enzyme subunit McrC